MRQTPQNRFRRKLAPADVRALCHEVLPIGDGAMPTSAVGWQDRKGQWTRIEAKYPNGWTLSFSFGPDGQPKNVTSRQTFVLAKDGADQ